MPDLFQISQSVKEKVLNPRNTLINIPILDTPVVINRKSILSVCRITKLVYLIYCPEPIYISVAFNNSFTFEDTNYREIILRKCYDSIYFDFSHTSTNI